MPDFSFAQNIERALAPDPAQRASAFGVLGDMVAQYSIRDKNDFVARHHMQKIGPLLHRGLEDTDPTVWKAAATAIFRNRNKGSFPESDAELRADISLYAKQSAYPLLNRLAIDMCWGPTVNDDGRLLETLAFTCDWFALDRFPVPLDGGYARIPTPPHLINGSQGMEFTVATELPSQPDTFFGPFAMPEKYLPDEENIDDTGLAELSVAATRIRFLVANVQGLILGFRFTAQGRPVFEQDIALADLPVPERGRQGRITPPKPDTPPKPQS